MVRQTKSAAWFLLAMFGVLVAGVVIVARLPVAVVAASAADVIPPGAKLIPLTHNLALGMMTVCAVAGCAMACMIALLLRGIDVVRADGLQRDPLGSERCQRCDALVYAGEEKCKLCGDSVIPF